MKKISVIVSSLPLYCGVRGVRYVDNGPVSDSGIIYKGYYFTEWCISSALWYDFLEVNPQYTDKDAWTEPAEKDFTVFLNEYLRPYLDDCIFSKSYDYIVRG